MNAQTNAGKDEIQVFKNEISRLANAMMNGRLDARGDVSKFSGDNRTIFIALNQMLDALIHPLRVSAKCLDQIAHGTIPDFIIDDYKGEFDYIKRSINTFLAVMYGMHYESQNLIEAIKTGNLKTRGNDWDFEGNWRALISGVNDTLDAVTDPIVDAQEVLEKQSNFDLCARMEGTYRGDHAQIKRAINTTGETLREALAQVADSVTQVSDFGSQIVHNSQEVSEGASKQADLIEGISGELKKIALRSKQNAQNTDQARTLSTKAQKTVGDAKAATGKMLNTTNAIRVSAESSVTINREINGIAQQTDELATNAAARATKLGASAKSFGVVAKEIRRLAARSQVAANGMRTIVKTFQEQANVKKDVVDSFRTLTREIDAIATETHLLSFNAAIEAAHVDTAGQDFEALTAEVRKLSHDTKDAARKIESLIRNSVDMARKGQALSSEIDAYLEGVVDDVTRVTRLVRDIALASREQQQGVDSVHKSVAQVLSVTQLHADSAEASSVAAKDLEKQTQSLIAMIQRFQLGVPDKAHASNGRKDRATAGGIVRP